MPLRCPCASAHHEVGCPVRRIGDRRGRLYRGLYDAPAGDASAGPPTRVRLLNAGLIDGDGDATTLRFALLEID